MSSSKKIAIVTGSNKGIGFAIVRGLCKQFDGDVILTSRDEGRGQEAIKAMEKEGLKPKFHQLDIDDAASVTRLADDIKKEYGGIDVLVNNAGIAVPDSKASFPEQARMNVKTNFNSTLNVCRTLFPLLKPHARVVNVSSGLSHRVRFCSEELQKKLKDPNLTMEGLEALMAQFVSLAQENKHEAAGWYKSAYATSKMGCTKMSFIQQKEIDAQKKEDIIVNACCPGYVDTDLTNHSGTKTPDQGADTPVYLALLPPNTASPRGAMVEDRKIKVWGTGPPA